MPSVRADVSARAARRVLAPRPLEPRFHLRVDPTSPDGERRVHDFLRFHDAWVRWGRIRQRLVVAAAGCGLLLAGVVAALEVLPLGARGVATVEALLVALASCAWVSEQRYRRELSGRGDDTRGHA